MIDLSMTNFHSSLAQLLQSNVEEVSGSPTSLFDLINAHKSAKQEYADDVNTLSDLASKRLNLEDENSSSSTTLAKKQSSGSELGPEDTNSFNTLEEYTQSFLSSNSGSTFLSQTPLKECVTHDEVSNNDTGTFNNMEKYGRSFFNTYHPITFLSQKPLKEPVSDETTTNIITEKLSSIELCDSSPYETRKIDLTATLLGSTHNVSMTVTSERITRSADRASFPLRECVFDISTLADEDMLYSNEDLSHFGYVINKKWSCSPFPKKYHKIGRSKPYNVRQAFKFDTPSPDDIALKARNRTTSGSKD